MKKRFLLIGLIALTIAAFSMAACKTPEEQAREDLKGTWEMVEEGAGTYIKFDKDTFELGAIVDNTYKKENVVKGTFVAKDGTITFDATEGKNLLSGYGITGNTAKYSISGSTLKINDYTFKRK